MGGSSSRSEIVNESTSMVATIMTNVALSCNADAMSSQMIDVNCQPPLSDPTVPYESNQGCIDCMDNVLASRKSYYAFQKELWESGKMSPGVRKPIDEDFQQVISEMISCGMNNCKACVVHDLSQKTVIQSVIGCKAFNNVSNTINQKLMASVTQKLTNNQDMLSSIAQMLGSSSTQQVATNITNRISSKLTTTVIANITQQISSQQTINITFSSGTATGLSQQSAYHSVSQYLGKTGIFNNIFSDAEFKDIQTIYNKQNTIDSLGNVAVKSLRAIEKLLKSTMGQVMMFVLILSGVITFGIIVFIIVKQVKRHERKKLKHDANQLKAAQTLPEFEQF